MFRQLGIIAAVFTVAVLSGLTQESRAAYVSLASVEETSSASLLSSTPGVSSRRSDESSGPQVNWPLQEMLRWQLQGLPAVWWSATEGMSQPAPQGSDVSSPQLCALSEIPETENLLVIAQVALQEQLSLPPPLASRLFRPPRTGN